MNFEQTEQPDLQESEVITDESLNSTEQTDVIDLDSVDKFKFDGKEWTPKDLKSAYMMQSDYTKKTQALAEQRKQYEELSQQSKYWDHLDSDLRAVKSNPQLAQKFKEIYPEKFHGYLSYVLGGDERTIKAIESELDAKFSELSKKYPLADEEAVIARAQAMLERGQTITDSTWDQIWKSVHERFEGIGKNYFGSKVKQQMGANKEAKDIGAGGGIAGKAPLKPKSIKEASKMLMADLSAQG